MEVEGNLNNILEKVPLKNLLQSIQAKAASGKKDIVGYIRGIFLCSTLKNDECEKRRYETFKCVLSILQNQNLSSSIASELEAVLLLKIDSLQTSNLMKLAEVFIEHARNNQSFGSKGLEIFSKILSCLSHRDTIVYNGTDMSGVELRKNILSSLFSANSNIPGIVQLASVLKDVDLSENEMELIAEKLLELLPEVELIEQPPFIYQLLLLSAKGKRRQILQGIVSYFIQKDNHLRELANNNEDSDNIDDEDQTLYRQTEGTVILMISVTSRHDQSIEKEYLHLLKQLQYKPEIILSPFSLATSLSLSKMHHGVNNIFDSLKKSLVFAFQLKEKRNNSIWLRNLIPCTSDILELTKEAIKSSEYGWDHICQGLVKFGFAALDAFGPKYVLGNVIKTVSEEGCRLGSQILRDTFKSHRIVRIEIFEQLLSRIMAKAQRPISHYIDILSQIVQNDPLFLLDVLPKLVEVLDYIHFLPSSNAENILHSLAPLLKISLPLKDTLMLVLRKALFHRDVEARKVAVCGYLMILKKIQFLGKVSLSQSQTSVSSQASSSSLISTQVKADVYVGGSNLSAKTMCLEIMGLLKRALMQQGEIRQLLYEGLYDVILQNISLKDIILELLLGQFEKYYIADNTEIPLNFDMCFQDRKNVLEEPLAHLITSIHLILLEANRGASDDDLEEDYNESAQKMLEDFLQNLINRMCEIDINDICVSNKDGDEASDENDCRGVLLLHIYESLMECSLIRNEEFEPVGCEQLLKLYSKYKEISDKVNIKKQNKTSKMKTNSTSSTTAIHLTLHFLSKIMSSLFANGIFKHQQGLNTLRADSAFVIQMVTLCNQKLLRLSESGVSDGFSQVMVNSFKYIVELGKIYLKMYSEGLNTNFPSLEWENLSLLISEGLASLFNYVSAFQKNNMSKFITGICDEDCLSSTQALQFILKSIQKSIMKFLSDTENDTHLKESVPLISVIKILYSHFTQDFSEDMYKWIKQLCSQQVFQNASLSKTFLSLCLTLGHQDKHFLPLLRDMAFDVHYHLGDTDPDITVRGTPNYNIIAPEVARTAILNLISNLEQLLDELEWVLNFMKANVLVPIEFSSISKNETYDRESIEAGVCTRIADIIHIFNEIVQTSVPPDHTANSILKLVTKFYKILCSLTKYYLSLNGNKISSLPLAFEKVVKLSGTKLTTQVYSFITYIQMISEEDADKKKKTKSKTVTFKAVREVKTIPALVFEIETYEKNLIILSKKFKKNLVSHMKLSTARDFRINAAAITVVPEQEENDEIMNEESVNDNTTHSEITDHPNPEETENIDGNAVIDQRSPDKSNVTNESKLSTKRKRLGIRGNSKKPKV